MDRERTYRAVRMDPRSIRRVAALICLSIVLVAAGDPVEPADLIREGNNAYIRGDFEEARSLYRRAEERTADPGLVAFNLGAALYRQGDFRRAELCFRRSLGDADISPDRRVRALYNLANSLVRQAGEIDVKLLQSAIDCYELAILESTDDGVRNDAAHNLEVAKLLWARARAKRPPGERDPEWDDPGESRDPPPDPSKRPDDPGSDGSENGAKKADPKARVDLGKGTDMGPMPKEVEKATPGHGSLPVIPDTDRVESLSPEDARAVLRRAAERLQKERQKLREEAAQGDRPRANDW